MPTSAAIADQKTSGGRHRDRDSPGEAASAEDKKEESPERGSRAQEAQPIGRVAEAGEGDGNQDEVVQGEVDHVTGLRCCTEQPHSEDNHNEMEAKKKADKQCRPVALSGARRRSSSQ